MNSISSDTGEGLDTHLKSADFFDTENYPESTLSVTGYGNDMIKGNLTLNGITQPVLMPTEVVQQEDGSLLVTAQYSFDRTQFNITYSSGKLFQDLGDKAINDLIVFDTRIVANSATE
jgi:polyisoprenoid-binding protein YceI